MTKQELIEKLLWYKANLKNTYCDIDSVISDAVGDICDYDSDNDYELDSYTYTFETYDWIIEFIKVTLQEHWLMTLKNRLSELDWDYEYYTVDNVDWTIYWVTSNEVEEWIDDILSELWYEEDETTD